MRRNKTPGGKSTPTPNQARALDPAQEIALAALLAGKPVTEAATVAGCHRSSVWRWLTDDPSFIAAYNLGRRELVDQNRAELLALGPAAVKVIRNMLEQGTGDGGFKDFQCACKVLEMIGCAGAPSVGSIDPEEIAMGLRQDESSKAIQERLVRFDESLAEWALRGPKKDAEAEALEG